MAKDRTHDETSDEHFDPAFRQKDKKAVPAKQRKAGDTA